MSITLSFHDEYFFFLNFYPARYVDEPVKKWESHCGKRQPMVTVSFAPFLTRIAIQSLVHLRRLFSARVRLAWPSCLSSKCSSPAPSRIIKKFVRKRSILSEKTATILNRSSKTILTLFWTILARLANLPGTRLKKYAPAMFNTNKQLI